MIMLFVIMPQFLEFLWKQIRLGLYHFDLKHLFQVETRLSF